ncbi:Uncharacterized protein ChrSV_2226 [Chromobacterium vaccinii]|nr:Uncharacterized protein ChrSW_2226 [Chromobacterium vaccinii]QND89684.1 Uncharacterized protein ChrSV_2226 [Chromobacterium vaccinii]
MAGGCAAAPGYCWECASYWLSASGKGGKFTAGNVKSTIGMLKR